MISKRGRKRQTKNFQASELEFYRKELTDASSKQDLLATAQAFHNIKELTGWPVSKMSAEFEAARSTIKKYLKVLLLPEPILNCWAAGRMASPVALMFLNVNVELREALFHEMETAELSFHRMDKLKPLFDRAIAAYSPAPSQPEAPVAPAPQAPPLQEESPSIVAFTPSLASGTWKFGGFISNAGYNITRALNLSSNEIEAELSSTYDITRLRSALRQLIEQSEIGLSMLNHIAEAHKIRRSMLTYSLPVAAHT